MLPREVNRAIESRGGFVVGELGCHRRYAMRWVGPRDQVMLVQTAVRQQPWNEDVPLHHLRAIEADLGVTLDRASASPELPVSLERPLRGAYRLVNWVMRFLPPAHQSRYRREYLAELHSLAEEGASARVQLAHAIRVATTLWSLRRALAAPRPGGETAR